MGSINETVAKRVAKLFRMLASDFDGEVLAAVHRMKHQLGNDGLSINDIATVIENAHGEIEELRFSQPEVEAIYQKAVEKGREQGRDEEARKQQAPPEFYDEFGEPRWFEIATFCQKNSARLSTWEKEFISSVAGQAMYRPLSPKQSKHLLAIFVKLGGTYHHRT